MVTLTAMTRPMQFCIFYFPDCTEKKQVHQKQQMGMRSSKEKGTVLQEGKVIEK